MRDIGRDTVGFLGQTFDQITWADIGYSIAGIVVLLIAIAAIQWTVDEWRLWRWRKRLLD
jgi:hypothetical protein